MKLYPGKLVQWRGRNGNNAVGKVVSIHTDGAVPGLPQPLQVRGEPIARIQVLRDRQESEVFVGVPASKLADFVETARPITSEMGTPTEQQMGLINQYLPKGARRLQPSEVVTIPFIAADNLLNRGMGRWDADSIKAMAQVIVGKPAMLDHDWDDVETVWGRVYDAQAITAPTAPDSILNQAKNAEANRLIVQAEGFWQCLIHIFAPADSEIVAGLADGRFSEVSTGGFEFEEYWCPVCDTSFSNPKCPHYIPYGRMARAYGNSDLEMAPYYTRKGLYDICEISLVTCPNLPMAGVVK